MWHGCMGEGIEGLDNGFEIREASVTEWEKVPEKYVTINGAAFTACVPHLKAQTTYVCRAYSGENYGEERSLLRDKLWNFRMVLLKIGIL